ncbi:hypothetical protein [Micromonospora sp. NPDC093244]
MATIAVLTPASSMTVAVLAYEKTADAKAAKAAVAATMSFASTTARVV